MKSTHFHRIHRAALSHHKTVVKQFHHAHKHAHRLFKRHRVIIHKVRDHSVKTAAVASVSAGLLAAPTVLTAHPGHVEAQANPDINHTLAKTFDQTETQPATDQLFGPDVSQANKQAMFKQKLSEISQTGGQLTAEQEAELSVSIQEAFGFSAKAELEGKRLNATRGIIAGEQHLPLYPGDTIKNHFKNRITGATADPTANLTGMVPGLPSWGYFAANAASVTKQDVEREQWYIAAQTFLAPGWQDHTQEMYKWFKYRKMIVMNQQTGQAVVACIGDAGPSPFTKRTFGGSNEVLIALGLGTKRTGTVITFFVDDPNDTIPLGPLTGYPL